MAAFDFARRCFVVRTVFDGAALSGKTTTVQVIRDLFPTECRTEIYTPGSLKGRTMFFDWLEVEGKPGRVAVKFQLITVPGQVQRNYRRRPLVEMADVVVFVFDCSPEGIAGSLQTYQRLQAVMRDRERPAPLVVQANKQDVLGAIRTPEVRQLLRLDPEVMIVPAVAGDGRGVKKVVSLAMRLARDELILQKKLGSIERVVAEHADPDALFLDLLEREDLASESLAGGESAGDPAGVSLSEVVGHGGEESSGEQGGGERAGGGMALDEGDARELSAEQATPSPEPAIVPGLSCPAESGSGLQRGPGLEREAEIVPPPSPSAGVCSEDGQPIATRANGTAVNS